MGFSSFLIDKIFEGAREVGADCEKLNLTELKLTQCIGCQTCQTSEHRLKCIFNDKDDAANIYDKMRKADIIVFSTPIYMLGMSSHLKILFERYFSTAKVDEFKVTKSGLFFHDVDKDITQKPFVAIVVCDNLEDEIPRNTVSYFKQYAKFMDAQMVGLLVRKSAGMFKFDQQAKELNPTVSDVYDAYVQAGKELVLLGKIQKPTQKRANQSLVRVPFFVKPMLKLGLGKEKIEAKVAPMMRKS